MVSSRPPSAASHQDLRESRPPPLYARASTRLPSVPAGPGTGTGLGLGLAGNVELMFTARVESSRSACGNPGASGNGEFPSAVGSNSSRSTRVEAPPLRPPVSAGTARSGRRGRAGAVGPAGNVELMFAKRVESSRSALGNPGASGNGGFPSAVGGKSSRSTRVKAPTSVRPSSDSAPSSVSRAGGAGAGAGAGGKCRVDVRCVRRVSKIGLWQSSREWQWGVRVRRMRRIIKIAGKRAAGRRAAVDSGGNCQGRPLVWPHPVPGRGWTTGPDRGIGRGAACGRGPKSSDPCG